MTLFFIVFFNVTLITTEGNTNCTTNSGRWNKKKTTMIYMWHDNDKLILQLFYLLYHYTWPCPVLTVPFLNWMFSISHQCELFLNQLAKGHNSCGVFNLIMCFCCHWKSKACMQYDSRKQTELSHQEETFIAVGKALWDHKTSRTKVRTKLSKMMKHFGRCVDHGWL